MIPRAKYKHLETRASTKEGEVAGPRRGAGTGALEHEVAKAGLEEADGHGLACLTLG